MPEFIGKAVKVGGFIDVVEAIGEVYGKLHCNGVREHGIEGVGGAHRVFGKQARMRCVRADEIISAVMGRAEDDVMIPGASTPEEVVSEAFENLAAGPTWFVGEVLREGSKALGSMARNDAVRVMLRAGAGVMDQKLS